MGVTIYIYKKEPNRGEGGSYFRNYEREANWDSSPHEGDWAFAGNVDAHFIPDKEGGNHEDGWYRPKDFKSALKLVNEQVPGSIRDRWYKILDLMKSDPTLYFYFSF